MVVEYLSSIDPKTAFGIAGTITASSLFLPQVLKTYRTKSAGDISYGTIALGAANGVLWLGYGIADNAPLIIITNVTFLIAVSILGFLKSRYKN